MASILYNIFGGASDKHTKMNFLGVIPLAIVKINKSNGKHINVAVSLIDGGVNKQ